MASGKPDIMMLLLNKLLDDGNVLYKVAQLFHGQVTIIFIVSVGLSVCLFVQSFSQPSLIRFRSN